MPYLRYLLGTAYRQIGRQEDARPLLAMATGSAPSWDDPWATQVNSASGATASERLDQALRLR